METELTYVTAGLEHLIAGESSFRVPSSREVTMEAHAGMEVQCQVITQGTVALESDTDLQETSCEQAVEMFVALSPEIF